MHRKCVCTVNNIGSRITKKTQKSSWGRMPFVYMSNHDFEKFTWETISLMIEKVQVLINLLGWIQSSNKEQMSILIAKKNQWHLATIW